ncbi:helix-turn-helix domain-containing protein [Candidatus Micrarchaeota archaeon]|nr:helix-turn-helix domain-containing protein [Candidatus Micrarchaeota archaeon]
MPRKKAFELSPINEDELIRKIRSIDIDMLKQKRAAEEKALSKKVANILKTVQKYYDAKRLTRDKRLSLGLYTLEEAYDIIRKNGIPISFRAFCGRVERKSIPSVKIGRKRYIPEPVLSDWIGLHRDYYTVRQAYEQLKKHLKLNYRAFVGRIEKQSIPSLKIGTQRWVPKDVVESLIRLSKDYYDVSGALKVLRKNKIRIRRNTFERRLDRGRIPHIKVGGRRYIHKDTLNELIQIEKARQSKKK